MLRSEYNLFPPSSSIFILHTRRDTKMLTSIITILLSSIYTTHLRICAHVEELRLAPIPWHPLLWTAVATDHDVNVAVCDAVLGVGGWDLDRGIVAKGGDGADGLFTVFHGLAFCHVAGDVGGICLS